MVRISGPPAGVIRNKPIRDDLKAIFLEAADEAGADEVRISSGGQDRKGHGTRRTGSTRHDVDASGKGGAADLDLIKNGRVLNFQTADRAIFAKFITACVRRGVTGVGAGGLNGPYMGPTRIHAGFGPAIVWGHGGKSANAPAWLRAAYAAGKQPASLTRTLRRGDVGAKVEEVQRALGMVLPVGQYGIYGAKTEAAVRKYQRENRIGVDGEVGPETRRALGI